uniref:Uncharacterized protein n=1 Tax=Tanacetum cinerariifolium TaxID=118510 RepID=A0A6L2KJU8_TANCI|nr:hypothetical protein [Tanacetum cinerariifolium]
MGIRIPQSNVLTNVADKAITKEMHDGSGKATTTASSSEAEQGSEDSPVQARPERLSNLPNEQLLGEGNTSRSGEGSMQFLELMDICTKLSERVTSLENELTSTKADYNKALITLTNRVKQLEKQLKHKRRRAIVDSLEDKESSLDVKDSPKQGRMIEEIDKDENVNLVKSHKVWDQNHTFIPKDFEIKKEVIKIYGFNLLQESSKKQKLDEQAEVLVDCDQEEDEMKKYMVIVPAEEITID